VAQAAALIVAFALEADPSKTQAQPVKERPAAPIDGHAKDRPSLAIGAWLTGDIGSLPHADAGLALFVGGEPEQVSQ
jgi:hypothetical protein